MHRLCQASSHGIKTFGTLAQAYAIAGKGSNWEGGVEQSPLSGMTLMLWKGSFLPSA